MSEVKHYFWVQDGMSEGSKSLDTYVKSPLFDRVTAERDAAMWREVALIETLERWLDLDKSRDADKEAYAKNAIDLRKRVDALQALLAEAGERADVLEGLLRTSLVAMSRIYSAGRDFIIGAGSDCDSVELMMENDPTAREIRAALKPAEPAKDEHVCNGCGSNGWTANCKECVPY